MMCMGSGPKREVRHNSGGLILCFCKKITVPQFLWTVYLLFYFKSIFSSHNWKSVPKLLYLDFPKISDELERDALAKVRSQIFGHQYFSDCAVEVLTIGLVAFWKSHYGVDPPIACTRTPMLLQHRYYIL